MGALRRLGAARARQRRAASAASLSGEVDAEPRARRDRPRRARRGDRASSRRSPRTRRSSAGVLGDLGARRRRRRAPRHAPPRRCRSSAWPRPPASPERFVGLHVFNPVPEDEARRARLPRRGDRRDAPARARAVRGAGQDRRRGPRPARLRGQPPALPLPLQRGRLHGGDRHGARGRRPVHDARRRAPDGAARAAGLRRPRRRPWPSATPSAPTCPSACARSSPRAPWGARAAAACTTTD